MDDLGDRARATLTLAVLGVLFVAGVGWGFSRATAPFPERTPAEPCTATLIAAGDTIAPDQVMVTVLNAGGRSGLAGRTMTRLVDRGFAQGSTGNAPADTGRVAAQVWATDPGDPAAILLASYLGPDVEIVDRGSGYPGVTIVVGEDFKGVKRGRAQVTAQTDATVCIPPAPATPAPTDDASGAPSDTTAG